SLLAIYNAQQLEQYAGKNFVIQQVVWFIVGIGILAVIQLVDLEQLYKASTYIFIISVILLVILYFSLTSISAIVDNANSWFNLQTIGIPLSLQPSEFTKIGLIVYLGALVGRHKEKYRQATIKTDMLLLLKIGLVTVLPILFILTEPDLDRKSTRLNS